MDKKKLFGVLGLLVLAAFMGSALEPVIVPEPVAPMHPLLVAEEARLLGLKDGHEVEAEGALMMFEAYSLELAEYDSFFSKHDLTDYPAIKFALWQVRDEVEFKAMDAEGWAAWNQEQADYYQEQLTGLQNWTGN